MEEANCPQWASMAGDKHINIIKWLIDYQCC